MLLFDVNIWVYAHRENAPRHKEYRNFVENVIANDISFGISTLDERFSESCYPSKGV